MLKLNVPLTEEIQSALHLAVAENDVDKVNLLLDLGANPNAIDNNGRTPLHLLLHPNKKRSESDDDILLALLKAKDVNPNIVDNTGFTPLHLALMNWDSPSLMEYVDKLLSHGANPNIPDNDGNTVLHFAMGMGEKYQNLCDLLMEKAEDCSLKNKEGKTHSDLKKKIGANQNNSKNAPKSYDPTLLASISVSNSNKDKSYFEAILTSTYNHLFSFFLTKVYGVQTTVWLGPIITTITMDVGKENNAASGEATLAITDTNKSEPILREKLQTRKLSKLV